MSFDYSKRIYMFKNGMCVTGIRNWTLEPNKKGRACTKCNSFEKLIFSQHIDDPSIRSPTPSSNPRACVLFPCDFYSVMILIHWSLAGLQAELPDNGKPAAF